MPCRKQKDAAVLQEAIARLGEDLTTDNIVYAADVNYWTVAANEEPVFSRARVRDDRERVGWYRAETF